MFCPLFKNNKKTKFFFERVDVLYLGMTILCGEVEGCGVLLVEGVHGAVVVKKDLHAPTYASSFIMDRYE